MGSVNCNQPEIARNLLDKILVERLTQNHAQGFSRQHSRCPKIEFAVVAHNIAEIPRDKRRRVKASRALRPRAVRLRLVSIPHAHLAPRPFRTMRSCVAENVRIQLSTR